MKEIFLSFRPEYFKPLLYGIKKYEYRKRFCDEETKAYLYLSGKSRQVVGILELGRPIRLDRRKDDYLLYPDTFKRVENYIEKRDINAIPIKSLTLFEKPVSLEEIRENIPGFMPPQMYFVLDNHPKLKEMLRNRTLQKELFFHEHRQVYYDNLAMSVSELKKTEEFRKLEEFHQSQGDFDFLNF